MSGAYGKSTSTIAIVIPFILAGTIGRDAIAACPPTYRTVELHLRIESAQAFHYWHFLQFYLARRTLS